MTSTQRKEYILKYRHCGSIIYNLTPPLYSLIKVRVIYNDIQSKGYEEIVIVERVITEQEIMLEEGCSEG